MSHTRKRPLLRSTEKRRQFRELLSVYLITITISCNTLCNYSSMSTATRACLCIMQWLITLSRSIYFITLFSFIIICQFCSIIGGNNYKVSLGKVICFNHREEIHLCSKASTYLL